MLQVYFGSNTLEFIAIYVGKIFVSRLQGKKFTCILNRLASQQLNWSTTTIASPRSSQRGEASARPKKMITKPVAVALCARGGYKASFEACLVDLGGLEKQQKVSWHGVVLCQFSQGFSTQARFWTGYCCPTTMFNGFKLVIVAVTTRLIR